MSEGYGPGRGLSSRRTQIVLIIVAVIAGNYARTALGPIQEAMAHDLNLTDNQVALLQGLALAAPLALAAIPLGIAVDRLSRARLMLGLSAASVITTILSALAGDFPSLFVMRCLVGVTGPAVAIVALSLIADLFPPEQRGRATMLVGLSQMLGMAAVFGAGGLLLTLLSSGDAWREALLGLTVPLALAAGTTVYLREPERLLARPRERNATPSWGVLRHGRRLVPLLAGIICIETTLGALPVWVAPMLGRGFGLAPASVGSIVGIGFVIIGVAGPIAGGVLADRCQQTGGPRRTVGALATVAILATSCCLFAFVDQLWLACALLLAFAIAISAAATVGMALFTVVVPAELRGLAMSTLFATNILFGVGLAPLLVSVTSNFLGGPQMIGAALALLGLVTNVLAAMGFLMARRRFPAVL